MSALSQTAPNTGPVLQLLMGARATTTLGRDLEALFELPDKTRGLFWDVLKDCLGPQLDDRTVTRLKRFGQEHQVDPELLLPPVKSARFVLRHAARHNTSRDAFISDIKLLTTDENTEAMITLMADIFDKAFGGLRHEVVMRSVAEHGTLAHDVHWRLELLQASDHGVALDVPLTSLTFVCQEGQTQRNVTIQLLPDALAKLSEVCASILKD